MYYKITNPMAKAIMTEIDSHLAQIEVKGESVRHLFTARVGFAQLLETLVEVPDENDSKTNNNERERKEK